MAVRDELKKRQKGRINNVHRRRRSEEREAMQVRAMETSKVQGSTASNATGGKKMRYIKQQTHR